MGGDGVAICPQSEVFPDEYRAMVDEDVVEMARDGNSIALDFLMIKYEKLVRFRTSRYFLMGGDREDIIQEGMIGLYKAIRDFRPDRRMSFPAFAGMCITRQIITAIKTATRQKHTFLNSYVSLDKPIYDENSGRTLQDVVTTSRMSNPEDLAISREELDEVEQSIGETLSDLERAVLVAYLDGQSYQDIADGLCRHVKSVDNALQRVKRKLGLILKCGGSWTYSR